MVTIFRGWGVKVYGVATSVQKFRGLGLWGVKAPNGLQAAKVGYELGGVRMTKVFGIRSRS